jgi:ferritin
MRRLLTYMNETGSLSLLGGREAPLIDFGSLRELFEKIYHNEQLITQTINQLVHLAATDPDYSTLQFLQWYVAEQHQEEFLFKSILDKIDLIGVEGQGIFFIYQEVAKLPSSQVSGT